MQHINNIIEILQKVPQKRNPRDIFFLQNETKNIQFFKQYIENGDSDVHQKCCVSMKHQYITKDKAVFHIDTTGSKFYLILEGTVGVYIRLPKKRVETVEENSGDANGNAQQKETNDDLVCVKELHAGTGFGELALMNNKPRLASIICHTNCHLATLDKKEFTEILKEKEEEKLIKEMGFFASLPFFKGWNFNLVKMLYLNSIRVNFVKGDRIYKEGSEPLAVYIIVSGEFVLEKSFYKNEENDHLYKTASQEVRHLMGSNKKASKQFQISMYTNPELFGDEEIMEGQDYRKCTAICNSAQGQCIMIKKRDFEIRIMHEEGALSYLKERLSIKNDRMKEKIDAITKQIDNYKNFMYDDPKDFKKQVDFVKMYRTSKGRKNLDMQTLSDLKEMIQTGQDPAKKKKKTRDLSQPDVNHYEEGLIKSQTEIQVNFSNNSKEEEEHINSPKRLQSPDKSSKKNSDNALQDHFMSLLQKHVQKQKKSTHLSVLTNGQALSKSQMDISEHRHSYQQLQSQTSFQKFNSFTKFDGPDFSPTLHKMNKSSMLLSINNQKPSSKTVLPNLNGTNVSQYDISPQVTTQKFQKLRLQQSLLKPPNMVKQYDNPDGIEEQKTNKSRGLSTILFSNSSKHEQRDHNPSDSGKSSSSKSNTNQAFSQSQTDIEFTNDRQFKTDFEENRRKNKERISIKGKSQSQINLPTQQYTIVTPSSKLNQMKEDQFRQISIYDQISNHNAYQHEMESKNEHLPILLSPPVLLLNSDPHRTSQQMYSKQNTPDLYLNSQLSVTDDKTEALLSSQIFSSQQILRKLSSGLNKIVVTPSNTNHNNNIKINHNNAQQNHQILKSSKSNLDIEYQSIPTNNTQTYALNMSSVMASNNAPLSACNTSQHNLYQQKPSGLSYRSISAIIQNNIKSFDPVKKDTFLRSSGHQNLDQTHFIQRSPQKSHSPGMGFKKQFLSTSKSPSKLQPYKFQKEFEKQQKNMVTRKSENIIQNTAEKQFQVSKQKNRIYEAIHQNPKSVKQIKQNSIHLLNSPLKSPKQRLLPIKANIPIFPNSVQNSPCYSRQTEINTAYSEMVSPIQTQKNQLFIQNIARKSEFGIESSLNGNNINLNQAIN